MKKKKLLIVLVGILMISTAISSIAIAQGPTEKATGDFWAQSYEPNANSLVYLKLNAHEAIGDKPAKGEVYWYRDHPIHGDRDLYMNVEYVNVDDTNNKAYLGAYCWLDTAGSQTGKWLYLILYDVGTPGGNGDTIWARWYDTESEVQTAVNGMVSSYWVAYNLVEGNLVVHTYT